MTAGKVMRKAGVVLLVGAAAVYFGMLIRHRCYAPSGSDAGGYLNEAKLFAHGKTSVPLTILKTLRIAHEDWGSTFVPLGFRLTEDRRTIKPTYPAGAPILFAVAGLIGGWDYGPSYVSPIAAMLCLIGMVAIGRELDLPWTLAIAGAVMLAAFSTFILMSVQPVSDTLGTMWAVLSIWFALVAHRRPNLAYAAGAAFAFGVMTRPSNIVTGIAVALALQLRPRLLLRAVAGAFPLGVAMALWQWTAYGSPLRTGYGSALDLLKVSVVPARLHEYWRWLGSLLSKIIFPCGLLVAFDRRVDKTTRAMLLSWFFSIFIFYLFYVFGPGEWWSYTRFVMPGIPALIFGVLLVIRDSMWRFGKPFKALAVAIIVLVLLYEVRHTRDLRTLGINADEWIYPEIVRFTEEKAGKNSIVVSGHFSGTFLYYSGRITPRYDEFSEDRFALMRGYAGVVGYPWYAVVAPHEMAEFKKHLPGTWTEIGRVRRDIIIFRLDS